ncbi:hypothetical protein CHS0354_002955 [Potamilus streckersoni]|uniref:Ig-like domain-containing protein n=1 Tax=Potamilus streckersoni TaxID=2493646 RepID=A0AAE0VHN7_9BIVA|nr:hypothetical protein CHS0354_002955 [Potamilus streckersoni]
MHSLSNGPNDINFNEARMKNNPITDQITIVNCSADCYPRCEYSITVPGKEIVYSKETLHNVTENGNYTCRAINPATGKSSETRILTISYELVLSTMEQNVKYNVHQRRNGNSTTLAEAKEEEEAEKESGRRKRRAPFLAHISPPRTIYIVNVINISVSIATAACST